MSDGETGRDDHQILHRLVFFSDAVFAIVLTLLVLELRPPHVEGEAGLAAGLRGMTSHFIAFGSSFGLISIFWAAHMTIMRRLAVFDWPAAWLNLGFLFTIALMPFVSAMIGEHGVMGTAWQLYCVVLIAASITQTALLLGVTRDKGRLVGGITPRQLNYRLVRALSPGIAFSIGLALSLAGQPGLSALCWVLFAPILVIDNMLFGPKKAAPAAPAAEPVAEPAPTVAAPARRPRRSSPGTPRP